jgi:hypothetical protein
VNRKTTLTPGQLSYLTEVAAMLGDLPEQGEGLHRSDGLKMTVDVSLDGFFIGGFTQTESSWLFEVY